MELQRSSRKRKLENVDVKDQKKEDKEQRKAKKKAEMSASEDMAKKILGFHSPASVDIKSKLRESEMTLEKLQQQLDKEQRMYKSMVAEKDKCIKELQEDLNAVKRKYYNIQHLMF